MFSVEKKLRQSVVDEFLRSVLIEVATENYRQLMQESMALGKGIPLDPPLRANERVMSGLFANAISKVSARSRPEARIDRPEVDEEDEDSNKSSVGRVDFLAWYSDKTIAVELKVVGINWSKQEILITEVAKKRWKSVVKQAETAKKALQNRAESASMTERLRYPKPESIGLLVLVARSAKVTASEDINLSIKQVITKIKKDESINPEFIATYIFPNVFGDFVKKRKERENDDGKILSTPFVVFLAYLAK